MTSVDLVLHPVRLRIVQAFLGNRELSTAQLAEELSDVPKSGLYRHLAVLADADVLSVVGKDASAEQWSAPTRCGSKTHGSRRTTSPQ